MPNVEWKATLDKSQPEEALVQLRAAIRLPDEQILTLITHLKELKSETGKLAISIQPTKDGLAGLTATFKSNVDQAVSLSSSLRQLIVAQNAVAASTRGSAEAQKAELAERRVGIKQINAEADEFKRIQVGLRAELAQNAAVRKFEADQAKEAARALADLQKQGVTQVVAGQANVRLQEVQALERAGLALAAYTDAQRLAAQGASVSAQQRAQAARESAEKEIAALTNVTDRQRLLVSLQRAQNQELLRAQTSAVREQRTPFATSVPVNQMESFTRAFFGTSDAAVKAEERLANFTRTGNLMASAVLQNPLRALRLLATDTKSAGAAMEFLKSRLDFVINSRFGTIALGFLVFGTATAIIKSLVSEMTRFEAAFARVKALSIGQADAAQINAQAQDFLRRTALRTGISLGELAEKFQIARQATANAADAESLFTQALNLSIVSGAEFEQTLKALAGVFNVFGDQFGKALTDQQKFEQIASQIFTAAALSQADINDMTDALKFVGSQAALSGIPLTRLLAILTSLSQGMQLGSRGGRGLSQVLSSISQEAAQLNTRFGLGLQTQQIQAGPLSVIEELFKRLKDGRLAADDLRAGIVEIFPQNAERIFLTLIKLTEENINKFQGLIEKSINLGSATEQALNTARTALGRLGTIGVETFIGMAGGADAFTATMNRATLVAAFLGAQLVKIGASATKAFTGVGGTLAVIAAAIAEGSTGDLDFAVTREAFNIMVAQINQINKGAGDSVNLLKNLDAELTKAGAQHEENSRKAKEALDEFAKQAKAKNVAIPLNEKLTEIQQIELRLARQTTVSYEQQLRVRREAVALAERGVHEAAKGEASSKAIAALAAATKGLTEQQLQESSDVLGELRLRSDQITESNRLNAVVTEQAARSEIRARRGIIAEIQQQQAAVERLMETNQITERVGRKQLDDLQKFLNQQLQASRQVEEAARTATQQRVRAFRSERDAGENLADLQLRQAQQRIDAETTVRKARERILKDTRALEDQQRKTLETQALGRVRLLLGFPEQANELLLTQLDRIRQAQEFANLPLREREQLLRQEFALLEKLKGKEEERLDQEILFGKDFANIIESQRSAVEGFLASDPVRRAAAERKAKLKFGRVTPEGILAAGGEALGIRGLVPETADEERRQIREIEGMGGRRVELEKVIRGQLDEELKRSKELERERVEAIAEANVALDKAIRDQADLLHKQPIEMRKATESLKDAHEERLRIEKQFTESTVQNIKDHKAAIAAAQAAGTGRIRPDVATDDLTEEEQRQRIRDVTESMARFGRAEIPGTPEFEQFQRFREEALRQQQRALEPTGPRLIPQSFQFQESLEAPLIRANALADKLHATLAALPGAIPDVVERVGPILIDSMENKLVDRITRELNFSTGGRA